MEDTYGCNLINTKRDGRQVTEFVGRYHVYGGILFNYYLHLYEAVVTFSHYSEDL